MNSPTERDSLGALLDEFAMDFPAPRPVPKPPLLLPPVEVALKVIQGGTAKMTSPTSAPWSSTLGLLAGRPRAAEPPGGSAQDPPGVAHPQRRRWSETLRLLAGDRRGLLESNGAAWASTALRSPCLNIDEFIESCGWQ